MIDSYNHVELGGVGFRLAEGVEGRHYTKAGQTVRPPGSSVVQGENNLMQLRQEIMVWSVTDWSGGEGKYLWDPNDPGSHWRLHNVDAFTRPGRLSPAPSEVAAQDENGDDLTDPLYMLGTDTQGRLFALKAATGTGNMELYINDSDGIKFTASGDTFSGGSSYVIYDTAMQGDRAFIALHRTGFNSNTIFLGEGELGTLNSDIPLADTDDRRICAVGDYVYIAGAGKVWEVPITGSLPAASTLVDDQSNVIGAMQIVALANSENRAYAVWTGEGMTKIREITPTTAAGPGFGSPLAFFGGLKAQSAWVIGETLFIGGQLNLEPVIMYVSLGNLTYGTLGKVQPRFDGVPPITARAFFGGDTRGSFLEAYGYYGFEGDITDAGSQTFNSNGTFTVPAGVTEIDVAAWGGGAGGQGGKTDDWSGGGGGGGAYSKATLAVTPGQVLNIFVGAGGAAGAAGGVINSDHHGKTSWVEDDVTETILVSAEGGFSNSVGGRASQGVGDIKYSGGIGGTGAWTQLAFSHTSGGGGGGSARVDANGSGGSPGSSGSNVAGGSGGSGTGSGGRGGASDNTPTAVAGGVPGGGGGGGGARFSTLSPGSSYAGKAGGKGRVTVAWGTSVVAPSETGEPGIYVIDQVTGGMAQWATGGDSLGQNPHVFPYQDAVFYTLPDETRVVTPRYMNLPTESEAYFQSGSWHFGIQEEKVLQAMVVHTDPLPAGWQITLYYQLDDSGDWLSAGTYGEEGGRGIQLLVSSSDDTTKFRSIRVMAEFERTADHGTETIRPTLLGVEVVATVTLPFMLWELLLDVADDNSGVRPQRDGGEKAAALEAAYLTGQVVRFKDGYASRLPGEYSEHDVFIDGFEVNFERPGEGVARVLLREATDF